ncbi:hypothetical protein PM082_006205 [Marasmius tenuissimus]|nr:hypothetical protein PM082_006205 [Marasmius tenuissimus]
MPSQGSNVTLTFLDPSPPPSSPPRKRRKRTGDTSSLGAIAPSSPLSNVDSDMDAEGSPDPEVITTPNRGANTCSKSDELNVDGEDPDADADADGDTDTEHGQLFQNAEADSNVGDSSSGGSSRLSVKDVVTTSSSSTVSSPPLNVSVKLRKEIIKTNKDYQYSRGGNERQAIRDAERNWVKRNAGRIGKCTCCIKKDCFFDGERARCIGCSVGKTRCSHLDTFRYERVAEKLKISTEVVRAVVGLTTATRKTSETRKKPNKTREQAERAKGKRPRTRKSARIALNDPDEVTKTEPGDILDEREGNHPSERLPQIGDHDLDKDIPVRSAAPKPTRNLSRGPPNLANLRSHSESLDLGGTESSEAHAGGYPENPDSIDEVMHDPDSRLMGMLSPPPIELSHRHLEGPPPTGGSQPLNLIAAVSRAAERSASNWDFTATGGDIAVSRAGVLQGASEIGTDTPDNSIVTSAVGSSSTLSAGMNESIITNVKLDFLPSPRVTHVEPAGTRCTRFESKGSGELIMDALRPQDSEAVDVTESSRDAAGLLNLSHWNEGAEKDAFPADGSGAPTVRDIREASTNVSHLLPPWDTGARPQHGRSETPLTYDCAPHGTPSLFSSTDLARAWNDEGVLPNSFNLANTTQSTDMQLGMGESNAEESAELMLWTSMVKAQGAFRDGYGPAGEVEDFFDVAFETYETLFG